MRQFNRKQLDQMDHLYRINLINSCSGYKSANLIGTLSGEGQPNLAIFSSVIHMGSNPPLLGFILRPTTVLRHTYENIRETGAYTINHVPIGLSENAHHTSAKYDATVSEFEASGLSEEYKGKFHAPFVKGSPVQMSMSFVEEHFIESNGTRLVIGEIRELYLQDDLLAEDGFVDLSKGEVASICGLDGYALPSEPRRFGYQRPKEFNRPEATGAEERSKLF